MKKRADVLIRANSGWHDFIQTYRFQKERFGRSALGLGGTALEELKHFDNAFSFLRDGYTSEGIEIKLAQSNSNNYLESIAALAVNFLTTNYQGRVVIAYTQGGFDPSEIQDHIRTLMRRLQGSHTAIKDFFDADGESIRVKGSATWWITFKEVPSNAPERLAGELSESLLQIVLGVECFSPLMIRMIKGNNTQENSHIVWLQGAAKKRECAGWIES